LRKVILLTKILLKKDVFLGKKEENFFLKLVVKITTTGKAEELLAKEDVFLFIFPDILLLKITKFLNIVW